MAVTLKFQSSGMVPGDGRPVVMRGGSLTVGRGPANDLVLPDPDRMLSKNHFVIEDHNGNIVIVDLSTNGTFLNYSKIPLGRTPTPLNDGDVLSLGGYELVVEIGGMVPADFIADPLEPEGASHGAAERAPDPLALLDEAPPEGDFLDDLLGGDSAPTGPGQFKIPDPIEDVMPPVAEGDDPFFQKPAPPGAQDSALYHNATVQDSFGKTGAQGGGIIPEDWDDLLEPGAPEPDSAPVQRAEPPAQARPEPPQEAKPASPPPPEPEPEPLPEPPAPRAAPAPTAAPAAAGGDAAARAYLAALEVEDLRIADADLPATMARLGRVMRAMITGVREILMTRTSIKSEFRIDQTMISAGGNNPLKFSISPEQAIEALARPRSRGYLDAEAAALEALNDIKAHEVAMVSGMEAALKGVLKRLDPDVVAGEIETSGALGSLFKGKKARYWEVYERMYAQISDQAENDFHDLFSREFARAYKQQLDTLKRNAGSQKPGE
ncbi:MAG: type VI secretion system-associated FHA domain protein TagH [Roseivivax sp.]|nr:type VI secretion system-associated FHA domain protein TagH [Roseivivax sp.]